MTKKKPDPIDIEVGKRLRERRLLKSFSQQKLAALLGITFQQVQKYERGTNRVSASRLVYLSRYLECPISYFFEEPDFNWKKRPEQEFSKWVALFDNTDPETRKIVYRLLSRLSESTGKKEDDDKTTSL